LKKKTHEKTNVYIYQTTKTVLKSNENKRRNKIINMDREANIYSNDRIFQIFLTFFSYLMCKGLYMLFVFVCA
jgi:hypothetical protein